MTFDHDGKLWVTEHLTRRWSVFDSAGAFVKVQAFPEERSVLQRRVNAMRITGSGRLVVEMGRRGRVEFAEFDTLGHFLRYSAAIAHPPRPRGPTPIRDREDRSFVFEHREALRWALGPDETVWFAYNGHYRLVQMDLSTGDTLRIVNTSHRNDRKVFPAAEARIRELLQVPMGSLVDHGIVQPVVDAIHVMDDGHVWVQITEKVGDASGTFDVFDPDGVFLGTVITDFKLMAHGWGVTTLVGDTLLGVAEGRLDVPYIVRAEIIRED